MQASTRGGHQVLRAAASVESASLELGRLLHRPVLRVAGNQLSALRAGVPDLSLLEAVLGRLTAGSSDAVSGVARPGASTPAPTRAGIRDRAGGPAPGSRAPNHVTTSADTRRFPPSAHAGTAAGVGSRKSGTASSGDAIAGRHGVEVGDHSLGVHSDDPVTGAASARVAAAIAGVLDQVTARPPTTADGPVSSPTPPALTTADLAAAAGLRTVLAQPSSSVTPDEQPRVPSETDSHHESGPRPPSAPRLAPEPAAVGALGELVTRWQQVSDSGTGTAASASASGSPDNGRPSTPPLTFDRPAGFDDQLAVEQVEQVERVVEEMLRREAEQHGLTGVDR